MDSIRLDDLKKSKIADQTEGDSNPDAGCLCRASGKNQT